MKTMYDVRLRRDDGGEEHVRRVLAPDAGKANETAIRKAKAALPVMADRAYATFAVVSCEPIGPVGSGVGTVKSARKIPK